LIRARIFGIDAALQMSLGFERRDAVAHRAARGAEGLGQLRWLDQLWRLEKQRCQNKAFEETQLVGCKSTHGERVEPARGAGDGKHGAFIEKGVDSHAVRKIV